MACLLKLSTPEQHIRKEFFMAEIDINQVLAQMRVISASAAGTGRLEAAESTGAENTGVEFSTLLRDSLEKVNEAQMKATRLASSFEAGKESIDLPEVMIAVQKASISFQAMNQVRNKLLSAYQEIMNMQV
jgi:flagellar hook-basal body complex protein FliE